jgi:hypothetical protein
MSIWDCRRNFAYDGPPNPGVKRHAALNDARGDYSSGRLPRAMGVYVASRTLHDHPAVKCIVFGSHRGCGESTGLRAIAAER